MSDATKAVFLSYASQDAEAAKKICDALRAAGVEVWFDQSELVGGDAWDQKIRKQIRECALLIPIISAATQARTEGYFRLEWRLADQRTHLMGRAKAFLLPVCIDDTKDADADVPDSFSAVQWTRLPAGEGATAFAEQVKKLLSAEVAPVSDRRFGSAPQTNTGQRPVPHSPGVNKWWWVLPIFGVTMALLLVLKEGRKEPAPGVRPPIEMPAAAPLDPKVAEARALVAKAQPLHENLDSNTRADYELAEQMFKRAIELAPLDAEVWAHYSWFGNNYVGGGLDRTPARLAEVKQAADRALKLDPKSDMALFSWGNYYRREPASLDEAVRVLQELVVRRPDFLVARRVLALGLSNQKKYDEALAAADYVSAHDPGDTRTWITRFGILLAMGRPIAEAEAVLDASLAIKPTPRALVRKALLLTDRGDMAGAAAILARVPPAFQQDDRAVLVGVMVALAQRQPARVREILALFPRDYMEETNFPQSNQPKAMALGFAAWIEGKPELARLEWQQALHVVDERLATHRTDGRLHYLKTLLHAMLGQEKEAEAAFRLYAQITPSFNGSLRGLIELWLGRQEKVLDVMETWTLAPAALARLRADPAWAPLWGNPRFEALKANAVEPPAAPSSLSLSPSTLSAADSKSVAVLPFANLSGDPAQEYFSDGLTEEILSALTSEKDLRVPGRTSAFAFKGRTITAPEIARALNVAQVVEGSVRKSGNQVRITVTLTRASDGFSEPLGTFTEKLDDIFALQEKVARAVVEKLTKRTVTAAGVVVLTKNPEAYDLYLQARAERRNPERKNLSIDKQERLLQAAVALDLKFAAGWAGLAVVHADRYNSGNDRSADRLALAKAAIDKAFQLAPDTPEAISALGRYYLISASDYVRATEQFEKRVRLQPGNAEGYYELAVVQRRQGHWAAALTGFQKASELDPGDFGAMRSGIIRLLEGGRRYEEAARWQRRLVALQPDSAADGFNLAYLPFKASGSTREMEAFLAGLKSERESVGRRRNWAAVQGHLAEAIGDRQLVPDDTTRSPTAALNLAILLAASGDRPGARAVLAEHPAALRSQLEREPDNSAVAARLATIEALLGHADEALRAAQKAMELTPESVNPWDNTSQRAALAFVYAWTGDKDRAITEYAKLLRSVAPGSGQQNVYEMKHHPAYFPLQGDPRFEALLADPKNNQPLF